MGSLDKALGGGPPPERSARAGALRGNRVAFGDQLIDHPPLGRGHRLQLPPFRFDAQVVELRSAER